MNHGEYDGMLNIIQAVIIATSILALVLLFCGNLNRGSIVRKTGGEPAGGTAPAANNWTNTAPKDPLVHIVATGNLSLVEHGIHLSHYSHGLRAMLATYRDETGEYVLMSTDRGTNWTSLTYVEDTE